MDKSRALIGMSKGELFKYIMELEDEIEQLENRIKMLECECDYVELIDEINDLKAKNKELRKRLIAVVKKHTTKSTGG